jgi:hypothetical protein
MTWLGAAIADPASHYSETSDVKNIEKLHNLLIQRPNSCGSLPSPSEACTTITKYGLLGGFRYHEGDAETSGVVRSPDYLLGVKSFR